MIDQISGFTSSRVCWLPEVHFPSFIGTFDTLKIINHIPRRKLPSVFLRAAETHWTTTNPPPSSATYLRRQTLSMVASGTAEAIVQARIRVDVKEKCSLFHEAAGAEWHISDNHRQALSLSNVHPVDIAVRNLEVQVEVATSFADTLRVKFAESKFGDVEGGVGRVPRKILRDISANFPAGTLTAIIGGSGSGKVVHLHPHSLHLKDLTPYLTCCLIDDVSQRSLPSHAGIKSRYHRNHTLQRIPRPSHSRQCLRHPNRCPDSVPHRPRNLTLRCIPSTTLIYHFPTA
jgi:hypothetical protein